jgi:hypothetical protein
MRDKYHRLVVFGEREVQPSFINDKEHCRRSKNGCKGFYIKPKPLNWGFFLYIQSMLKESLKSITLVTALLIYFYVCGGLYLIAFWSTFDLDISSFISLSDIPKNFVFPFIITNALVFILMYMQHLFNVEIIGLGKLIISFRKGKVREKEVKKKGRVLKWFKRFLMELFDVNTFIILFFSFSVYYYDRSKYSATYWGLACGAFFLLLSTKLREWEWLDNLLVKYPIMAFIRFFVILFPVSCFVTGKISSLRIYNNDESRTLNAIISNKSHPIIDSTSLKFLGFIGNRAIVSSLDNKKIVVLSQDAYEGLELGEIKKK